MDNENDELFQVSVKGLFLNNEKKLMMIQEDNGLWEIPGGRIQKSEELIATLKRECLEETGLECHVLDERPVLAYSAIDHTGKPRLMIYYKISFDNLNFTASTECVDIKFYSPEEIRDIKTYPQIEKLPFFLNNL